jgi:pimeloyl-ACP methyl ester carboxylesterase
VRRLALALLALVLSVAPSFLAGGASAGAKDAKKPTTSSSAATTTTTWPPLPAFDTTLAWADCGGGFQCATLTVPVDWAAPTAGSVPERQESTMGIALTRVPAAVPDQRIGSLVLNYGGPGESGVERLPGMYPRLPQTVRDRFDVVSFDPRGTGASRPIDCVDDGFLDLSAGLAAIPATEAQLDALHQYNAQFAAGCNERMGTYAGQVGTRNVARDLEAIRTAVGDPKLTYVGYSYGAALGAVYAQMFPASVGRVVLDGPPDYWISAKDYAYRQGKGFMDALSAFLDWCQQSGCSLAASGAPRDQLTQLIARVDQEAMPASYTTTDGVTRDGKLTPGILQNAVFSLLYDRRAWPLLGDALSQAVNSGSAPALLAYSDQYLGRSPDGHYDPLIEANSVITCVDRPTRKAPTTAAELRDVYDFQTQLPPWGGSFATASCVGMPKPAKGDKLGDLRVQGTAPILVIGTTGDPATPYAGAESFFARIQGAGLLTFDSTEHTAFGRGISTCIDDWVVTYLVDGTLPPPGTHCAHD